MFCFRAIGLICFRIIQRAGKTSYVILIRMCADDIFQMIDSLLLQVRIDNVRLSGIAAIHQHSLIPADRQDRIALTHVDKMNR